MDSDASDRIITMEDLYGRVRLTEIDGLEVELEKGEERPPEGKAKNFGRWLEALIIGVVGSLMASWIWVTISGGSGG